MDSGGASISEVVTSGDVNGLRLLIASGVDVNQTNKGGQTPLILATVSGHVQMLRLLLDAGADPLIRDNTGLNAIEWAERKGLPDVAKIFHEATPTISSNQQSKQTRPRVDVVNEPGTSASPPEFSSNTLSDDEKSRRWIAGLKQRFDEKVSRSPSTIGSDLSVEAQKIEEPSYQASPLPPNSQDIRESATLTTGSLPDQEAALAPELEARSARKKCPQCNTIYDSDLIAYCAYHVVPLVDIDAPIAIQEEADDSRRSLFIWLLVIITFFVAALIGLFLFIPRDNPSERVVAPSSTPPPVALQKGVPEASTNLKDKALEIPAASTALKIEKPESVVVRIKVDGSGQVSSVQSQYGNEELRRAAMDAARNAKFSADQLQGREVIGTIKYTFTP